MTESVDCRLYDDPAWLRQKYVVEGLYIRDLAALAGVSSATIRQALARHGIPTRSGPESQMRKAGKALHYDRRWLREKRILEGRTEREIAALAGVSPSAIHQALYRAGLLDEACTLDETRRDPGCTEDCPGFDSCLDDPDAPCVLAMSVQQPLPNCRQDSDRPFRPPANLYVWLRGGRPVDVDLRPQVDPVPVSRRCHDELVTIPVFSKPPRSQPARVEVAGWLAEIVNR